MRVLVTGANGHVGFNLCQALCARPTYTVRASVRSLDDESKTTRLRALGDLELVELDVCNAAQFDTALNQVEVLFHVAATYAVVTQGAQHDDEIIRDSVEGAEIALRAAAKAGVRKVVLTSSVVALPMRRPDESPATEDDWNESPDIPYFRAKTQAERAAWRLADELGIELVTILPGGVGGPGFFRRTPTTSLYEGIMLGTLRFGAPRANFTYVDARDVAEAHVLAAESTAGGRFVITNDQHPTLTEFSRVLHAIDPAVPAAPFALPGFFGPIVPLFDRLNSRVLGSPPLITREVERAVRGRVYNVSNQRARSVLGWAPRYSLEESLTATMEAIRALRRAEGKQHMA
jgi:dihydroflavonol-4-reductase